MQSDKPLFYPCWKSVLKHMNPDLRMQFAMRCPEIRTADKAVPIKLEYLEIDPNRITINKTKFSAGVVSHYLGGVSPLWAAADNARGGFSYDIGRFGDMNDPVVKTRMNRDRAPSDEETAQHIEDRRLLQETLTKLNGETVQTERKLLEASIKEEKLKIITSKLRFLS